MCYDNYAFIVITKNGSNEFLQSFCYNSSYMTLSHFQAWNESVFLKYSSTDKGKLYRLWQFPGYFGCGIIATRESQ